MILLWRRECQHIPVFLPREFHGQRILAGYSAWGHEESNTTKQLTLSLSLMSLKSQDYVLFISIYPAPFTVTCVKHMLNNYFLDE